jgi:Leucine-rich repeat (LRR) protein
LGPATGTLAKDEGMRTRLLPLVIGPLALAAGCLFDPSPRPHGLTLPTAPPRNSKENRNQYILAIRKAGGTVAVQEDEPDRPVLLADFNHLRLTGYVWEVLAPWKRCRELNLNDTGLTDADLGRLKDMPELVSLNLSANQITDAGLPRLEGLSHLSTLFLTDNPVGDAGIDHLRGLSELKELGLSGTRVTDAGLTRLIGHKKLEKLTLGGSAITDRSLETLKCFRGLRVLTLVKTGVTDSAVEELKLALPHLSVIH